MMFRVSDKSAQPGFNVDNIKKFTIDLPPFPEQQKISSILSIVLPVTLKEFFSKIVDVIII